MRKREERGDGRWEEGGYLFWSFSRGEGGLENLTGGKSFIIFCFLFFFFNIFMRKGIRRRTKRGQEKGGEGKPGDGLSLWVVTSAVVFYAAIQAGVLVIGKRC